MDITPLVPEDRQIVQSYGSGHFKVSRIDHQGSVIVLPNQTISWDVNILDDVNLESLAPVLAEDPRIEILLIGCGEMMQLLPRSLMDKCRQKGLAIDAMDTGAACRTYNILAAEGRRVAAGLVALS
ncbi:MAG: Mth938-like domain-containing protein [Alphaproteobacteria bacterium]